MKERELLRILPTCKTLRQLKLTHLQILVHGLGESNAVLSKLIAASSALQSPDYAVEIFQNCQAPDVATHNFMIKCFNDAKCPHDAFSTYSRMRASGTWPSSFTFTFLLRAGELLGRPENAKKIHAQVVRCGCGSHVFVLNCLINLYGKVGDLRCARRVFDGMTERDVVSWNAMMNAYMDQGDNDIAMRLFELMPERSVVSWNSVISGLLKAGELNLARSVFDRMPTRNEISCNAMITGYIMCGNMEAAQAIFDELQNKTVVSWTAMISGYAKTGDLDSMKKLFALMPVKNVVSWNAMIAAYNQNSQFSEALQTFQQMLVDGKFVPDEITLISAVSACAQLRALDQGNWVYSYIKKSRICVTVPLGNALIDMFAKCGNMRTSGSVFRKMTRKCVITWTTMISSLGLNGNCKEAIVLFEEMCREGIELDDVVFIAALTACAHGGLVEDGQRIFNRMVNEFGIKPRVKHYGCIADLLARAGKLEEAIQFVESMREEPEVIVWASLLSSCRTYGKAALVDYVSKKISEKESLESGYRVLISNLRAAVGKWQDVADTRHSMRCMGLEKVPGCSSIQVGGKVHEFLVKDTKHEMRKEVYETLNGLTEILRLVDFEPCMQDAYPIPVM